MTMKNGNGNDDSYEGCDSADEGGPKDYITDFSESSLWASIRDYLTPSDVLIMRTAGPKLNHGQLYGEFAAMWFFLVTKNGSEEKVPVPLPEWPSLRFDYRQNFGFDCWANLNGAFRVEACADLKKACQRTTKLKCKATDAHERTRSR